MIDKYVYARNTNNNYFIVCIYAEDKLILGNNKYIIVKIYFCVWNCVDYISKMGFLEKTLN